MSATADTTPALSPIFRESVLRHFEKPEHQAAVRVWGELLDDLIGEGRDVLEGDRAAPGEHWRRDAAGALGDLMQAQDELETVASLMEDAGEGENGARLLVALADAATAVEEIVAGLEAAIDRFVAGVAPEQASALRRNAAGYGQGAAHYAALGHPVLAGEQARIAAHCTTADVRRVRPDTARRQEGRSPRTQLAG